MVVAVNRVNNNGGSRKKRAGARPYSLWLFLKQNLDHGAHLHLENSCLAART